MSLPESVGPLLSWGRNNPHDKMAYFGVIYFATLQIQLHIDYDANCPATSIENPWNKIPG